MWQKILKESMAIGLISIFLAGAGYAVRPLLTPPPVSQQDGDGPTDDSQAFEAVTLEDAVRHFKEGGALFVDARSQTAYRKGHIKGAVNLEPGKFDDWSGDFFSRIPPDQVIIAYCEGTRCRLSLELAEKLTWMSYEKVYFLKNGWDLWKDNQLPTEPSP